VLFFGGVCAGGELVVVCGSGGNVGRASEMCDQAVWGIIGRESGRWYMVVVVVCGIVYSGGWRVCEAMLRGVYLVGLGGSGILCVESIGVQDKSSV
jgi:hypothetical protein